MLKIRYKWLTFVDSGGILNKNLILQTVEAGIKAMMPLQRVWEAESQAGNKLSNGPRRAQSNVRFHRVFCDAIGRRINAGDMLVSF